MKRSGLRKKVIPSPAPAPAPVKTSPLHDPHHHLTCKNCPVFSDAIFVPVKTSALNDPPPPLSHKNAVIKSVEAKSGQLDQVTVSVPKFTASLAYTTADKAIQDSSVLPKKVSVKRKQKKGNEEVKKEVIPAPVKTPPLHDPPPPLSHKNAVIKSVQAKSGQLDQVTVSVPHFTASLAYTTADKAIQASSVLPKKVSAKRKQKKGNEEVKKEVIPAPAPVKISPLNDPPPPLSHKNAVIKSVQAKSGQLDEVKVSVPKFTASLAYTTADKAIQASSVLPKKVSVKSEPKKGNAEVKKEEVVIKKKMVVHEGRWIKHYSSHHRILLVGDGDFSFSACLATAFRCAPNMIATSLDSEEFLMKNYNKAESNLKELKKRQCKVLHGIDATKMAAHQLLGSLHFDRIIFNFPFAGFFKTLSRDTQLRRHRKLVSKFLKNAKEMVSENGEIHISHKTNGFHLEWNLESMASSHRLRLIEAVDFSLGDYPGYNTKCGFGEDNNFECNPSKTYKWVRS